MYTSTWGRGILIENLQLKVRFCQIVFRRGALKNSQFDVNCLNYYSFLYAMALTASFLIFP